LVPRNASAVSDAPHYKSADRFGTSCGARPIQLFEGSRRWAANAPELQEDFGWRSNHVITLIVKGKTTCYYGTPIKYSYKAGNSKGGQAVLLEAQRFPEDFDGLMPSAPVYDYTGRSVIAAAWFAQGLSDGHGSSVLNAEAARAVHKSVLAYCGGQAGANEGLVTDPPSCKWQPEIIACASGSHQAAQGTSDGRWFHDDDLLANDSKEFSDLAMQKRGRPSVSRQV
jgi:Tannase and feruloyl esterase